ncbi:MAG: hypothetical protein ACI4QR_04715, partial [Eubacteriales bacterium]
MENAKRPGALIFSGYKRALRFAFRQNLVLLLISFVIMACAFPIRVVIMMNRYNNGFSSSVWTDKMPDIFKSVFNPNGSAIYVITLFLALVFSVTL